MCGIDGESCKLKAAYCCQPPMKYWETSKNLATNWYGLMDYIVGLKIYNLHICYIDYLEPIYRKLYGMEARQILKPYVRATYLQNNIVYKVNGNHKSPEDYLKSVSSSFHIEGIRIPVLFYFALDDPLIGKNSIDFKKLKENPNIALATTNFGSHLGCFENLF